jgi:hypothetical protein
VILLLIAPLWLLVLVVVGALCHAARAGDEAVSMTRVANDATRDPVLIAPVDEIASTHHRGPARARVANAGRAGHAREAA